MKKKTFLGLVMALTLTVGATLGTYAWFTGSIQTNNNNIQTGKISMAVSPNTTNSFTLDGKHQPGDTLTKDANGNPGYVTFQIVNDGNFDAVYFDNFVVDLNNPLADKIYIKNAKNTLYKGNGEIAWTDQYFTNGVKKYPFVDANNDGRISLKEWLADANQSISIGNGWHYSALKQGNKFVTEYELALLENTNNDYINSSIDIAYKVCSTQYNQTATQEFITNTIMPGSGTLDWTFVVNQYNQQ